MTGYLCDIGTLLNKDDKEFEYYGNVYNHEFGFYDLEQIIFLDKEKAIKYVTEIVQSNEDNTYAIITNQGNNFEEDYDPDDIAGSDYSFENIEYCIAKIDGKLVQNFLTPTVERKIK